MELVIEHSIRNYTRPSWPPLSPQRTSTVLARRPLLGLDPVTHASLAFPIIQRQALRLLQKRLQLTLQALQIGNTLVNLRHFPIDQVQPVAAGASSFSVAASRCQALKAARREPVLSLHHEQPDHSLTRSR
jgi:hypothetical protein